MVYRGGCSDPTCSAHRESLDNTIATLEKEISRLKGGLTWWDKFVRLFKPVEKVATVPRLTSSPSFEPEEPQKVEVLGDYVLYRPPGGGEWATKEPLKNVLKYPAATAWFCTETNNVAAAGSIKAQGLSNGVCSCYSEVEAKKDVLKIQELKKIRNIILDLREDLNNIEENFKDRWRDAGCLTEESLGEMCNEMSLCIVDYQRDYKEIPQSFFVSTVDYEFNKNTMEYVILYHADLMKFFTCTP